MMDRPITSAYDLGTEMGRDVAQGIAAGLVRVGKSIDTVTATMHELFNPGWLGDYYRAKRHLRTMERAAYNRIDVVLGLREPWLDEPVGMPNFPQARMMT
jgi:hypothetical protein